jgi:hypothetical protein
MIIRVASLITSLAVTPLAWGKDIAICGASEGYAYYPEAGLLPIAPNKDGAGWQKDGIKLGRITLSLVGDKFDVLYTDATGAVISAKGDGGLPPRGDIFVLRRGSEDVTNASCWYRNAWLQRFLRAL